MANLSITAADVNPGKLPGGILETFSGPANEAILAGQFCRFNVTTGFVELGNGSSAAEARPGGLASETVAINEVCVAVRKGEMDIGDALSALTFDDDVFLSDTDGTLADSAGTVTLVVGTVQPKFQADGATGVDKVLRVDL